MRQAVYLALATMAGLLTLAPIATAADERAPVVTRHQIHVNGATIAYTAEVGRIAIRDVETGEPHAYMFYTAYRMPAQGKVRPVMFLWGGGPGGYSANLNYELAGPMRANGTAHIAEGDRLIENEQTWLTDTDLVFVDAVGTGYSRLTKSAYADEFYGTIGDTNSFAEFVRCWRILHDAEDLPVFVGGLSWGAPRAATVGYALLKYGVPVRGIVMMSGDTSLSQQYGSPTLIEALRVVGMATVALSHGKLAPELGGDIATVSKAAEAWVRGTYAPALERVGSLSTPERTRIAAELARFTGMPVALIDLQTLIITPRQFHAGLVKDQGKTLYRSDLRLTTPIRAGYLAAAIHHLKYDLGYSTDMPYEQIGDPEQGFTPSGKRLQDVFSHWNYATSPMPAEQAAALTAAAAERLAGPPTVGEPLPATAEAIALSPRVKVLIATGRYDGATTCPGKLELERNLPEHLKSAMIFKYYDAGHSLHRTPSVLIEFSHDVKAMIRAAK